MALEKNNHVALSIQQFNHTYQLAIEIYVISIVISRYKDPTILRGQLIVSFYNYKLNSVHNATLMKIPLSSFSYLMRTMVARKIELVRNLNPFTESRLIHNVVCTRDLVRDPNSLTVGHRLMHMVACERESKRCLLSLHVGTKNAAACLFNPATYQVITVGPMLDKEDEDIFWLAKQHKHIIDQLNVCKVVVGRWPWSTKEEQDEYDLIMGATKMECFIDDLINTRILKDVKHFYYDARVVLNESGVKRRVRELKLEGKKEFSGDETELVEEFSDKYAAQFLLMHYLEFAGDVAFHGSHARIQKKEILGYVMSGKEEGEEQSENYLKDEAGKVESIFEDLISTGILTSIGYTYYDVNVLVNQLMVKKIAERLAIERDSRFLFVDMTELEDRFATKFLLMHLIATEVLT
ncbi:hypothetical protein LWI29_015911 [Acer saccharum]|uniref:Uncharacterized protein n=1 Tax=Acer saccharum TaxID=4024 RepID=A0AA39RHD5_ACESA|nr:hypothetical protein LWI29_015911 [Acer saccharum]